MFICSVTPGQADVDLRRDGPSTFSRSISFPTELETAPVLSLMISAVIDEAGRWSMRVMLPCASTWPTSAIFPREQLRWPTGSFARASMELTCTGSTRTFKVHRRLVADLDARDLLRGARTVRTWPATWAAVETGSDGAVRIDGDLDGGRGLGQVALHVDEVGVQARSAPTTAWLVEATSAGSAELTMTLMPPPLKPVTSETATS